MADISELRFVPNRGGKLLLMESDEIQFVSTQRNQQKWCTEEGVTPSSRQTAMTNVGYVHQEREVALASSILTLMPHKSIEPVSMQRAAK
ncbi:hypothetical protein T12_7642 [Trichinella patagoniensis]|uniref:Uncharacterized protein n=1 Tax=Trichinella patagoniensis TaxID=990121 RepID=A0A0V0ZGN5_9BILA|nr:hypothetical protein T12_7642 [Trichinella patagoniensis]